MKAYLVYKDKSVLGFKKLMNTGGGVFGKSRSLAASFIRYAGSDLDKEIAQYSSVLDIDSIVLENVFPTKYKWLISNKSLKGSRDFLKSLENRITEFQGKEDNLKILVGILFIKFVLITKITEAYLAAAYAYAQSGIDVSSFTLDKMGIGKSTLKYFDELEAIGVKTLDEWLAYTPDPVECKYFYSSMRRILMVLVGDEPTAN